MLILFAAVLDVSPSPVDSKFEENCEFNGITPVYHKIVDAMTVGGEGECAAKCAVSCAGTELCQFYKYDSCSKSCILGSFNKQGTQKPMVINDDNLPLSAIKVLKQDPAIIGRRIIVLPHVFELPFLKFLTTIFRQKSVRYSRCWCVH